mmetsp:Transcript_4509/g.11383  ORF Transcript_4509/g.11383 Transcript_4509/m.11383 type:complete len:296 (+) Transcript_4509:160-1047(+)
MNDNNEETTKTILLEDFQDPINKWTTLNDPVMGGKSYSNVTINTEEGTARFTGNCAIVPSLQAPGFITMETGSQFFDKPSKFPDVSSCSGFQIVLKTNVEYNGYRFSFGKAHANGGRFAFGYKAPILQNEHQVGEFGTVTIPFTEFSDRWDDATGDIITPCSEDDPSFCPSKEWLQRMETMSFWGEGVEGMVDLEIKSISAIGCSMDASETSVAPSMIQSKFHTISSNPFYLALVSIAAILIFITVTCITCCCCRYNSRRSNNTTTEFGIDKYKDEPTSMDDEDEFDDECDVELS